MRASTNRTLPAFLRVLAVLLAASLATVMAGADGDKGNRNLVVLEFLESPPSGLVVSGGFLGVPDSAGRFPTEFRRHDPVSGNWGSSGRTAGNHLLFTDLRPGTYRVALVLLGESSFASRVLPKHQEQLQDRCVVYGDTARALTFQVSDGKLLYLGRITRRSQPSLGEDEIWGTTLGWSSGDERKALRGLLKRRDLAPWKSLVERRLAAMDSLTIYRPRE